MKIFWRGGAGVVALTMTAGCLIKDTTQTWYLRPDGSVTWTVVESNVRSDARAAADRANEETTYWTSVKSETHEVAEAFRLLGGTNLGTRVVRAEVPYTVVTDARFAGIADLGQRLIVEMGLVGSSVLVRDADAWQWTMTIRDPHAADSQIDPEHAIVSLADTLASLKIVLVSGRFESAEGFVLTSDHRVATFDEKATNPGGENQTVVLRLRWVDGGVY
jgi:hypothetical protein